MQVCPILIPLWLYTFEGQICTFKHSGIGDASFSLLQRMIVISYSYPCEQNGGQSSDHALNFLAEELIVRCYLRCK